MPRSKVPANDPQRGVTLPRLGRPSTFDQDIADEICRRIAMGEPAVRICESKGMPTYSRFLSWRMRNPSFEQAYARARSDAADTFADQIISIADEHVESSEEAQRNRLRVDARKWVAAKLKPQAYGDQLNVNADVAVTVTVQRFTDAAIPARKTPLVIDADTQ